MAYENETIMVINKSDVNIDDLDMSFKPRSMHRIGEPYRISVLQLLDSCYYTQRCDDLENNPEILQIIPYCVIVAPSGYIFSYSRGKETSEGRLKKLKSIGLGGHVKEQPGSGKGRLMILRDSIIRELKEEVGQDYEHVRCFLPYFSGYIFDPSNQVGRVHLGILFVIPSSRMFVVAKDSEIGVHMTPYSWINIDHLGTNEDMNTYETWSDIVIKNKELLLRF